jgi:F-type H+-transporting ATPase subunit gamma
VASAKEIKNRIKSITNTKQIIAANELVSVIKMQKAVANNLVLRNFSAASEKLLLGVSQGLDHENHPYLKKRKGDRKLVIVITSDRGLCGGLNIKIQKAAMEEAKDGETTFVTIGKKGRDWLNSHGYRILAEFTGFGDNLDFTKIIPVIQLVAEEFKAGNYDKVKVIYTKFVSSLSQVPADVQLLPFEFSEEVVDEAKAELEASETKTETVQDESQKAVIEDDEEEDDDLIDENIIYEPSKAEIINTLIPRILETRLWQVFLESAASEHSARMVAMKNANENAQDLIYDLTLSYNQTRQAGITREIAEISAGKMILDE